MILLGFQRVFPAGRYYPDSTVSSRSPFFLSECVRTPSWWDELWELLLTWRCWLELAHKLSIVSYLHVYESALHPLMSSSVLHSVTSAALGNHLHWLFFSIVLRSPLVCPSKRKLTVWEKLCSPACLWLKPVLLCNRTWFLSHRLPLGPKPCAHFDCNNELNWSLTYNTKNGAPSFSHGKRIMSLLKIQVVVIFEGLTL